MQNKIIAKLNEVFDDIFGVSGVTVETTAKDVPGWDSLMHITLISEVEDVFGVKFTMKQILEMQNVGEMVDLIIEKGGDCE